MKYAIFIGILVSFMVSTLQAQNAEKTEAKPYVNAVRLKKEANGKYQAEKPETPNAPIQPVSNDGAPLASPTLAPATNGVEVSFEEEAFNFGKIKQGEVIEHTFKFTNTGATDLFIKQVRPACGCTAVDWPKEGIKAGKSGLIKLKFNSSGKLGKQHKTAAVLTNREPNGTFTLALDGEVFNPTLPSAPKTEPTPQK